MKKIIILDLNKNCGVSRETVREIISKYAEDDPRLETVKAICHISKSGRTLKSIDLCNIGSSSVKTVIDFMTGKVKMLERRKVFAEANI